MAPIMAYNGLAPRTAFVRRARSNCRDREWPHCVGHAIREDPAQFNELYRKCSRRSDLQHRKLSRSNTPDRMLFIIGSYRGPEMLDLASHQNAHSSCTSSLSGVARYDRADLRVARATCSLLGRSISWLQQPRQPERQPVFPLNPRCLHGTHIRKRAPGTFAMES